MADLFETYEQSVQRKLDSILALLNLLFTQGKNIMATVVDIQNAVTAEKTVEQGVITLLQQLSQLLAAAIAANDPVAMQGVVDSINANAAALAAAVVANTPPTQAPAKKP